MMEPLFIEGVVRRVLGTLCCHDSEAVLGDPSRWGHVALEGLVGTYGDRAVEVLDLTLRYIGADERMGSLMVMSGFSVHPEIVRALAPFALQAFESSNQQE